MRLRALAAAAGGLSVAAGLPAQRVTSSLDVSGTGVWYADSIRSMGSSLAPSIRVDWPSGTLAAAGSVSRLAGGGTSIQGMLAPSVATPSVGPLSGELTASLGGSSHHDGTRTGQALGVARGYISYADAGGWAGAGLGRTWDGAVWRSVRQAEVGAWLQRGTVTALATITPVVVEDSLRYTDFQAALRYPARAFELGLTLGARAGSVGPEIGGTSRAWGSVSTVAWLTSRLALVASAGTYPVDLTQGYPGGRFATIALRIASRNSRAPESPATQRTVSATAPLEPVPPAGVTNFEVRTVSGTRRTFRVNAPSARTVEINGDFTRWQPMRLTRGPDGWWTVSLNVPAGTHQLNARVDYGVWIVPPGLLTATDEFGGAVGILSFE